MKLRDSCMSKKKECIIATILTLVMAFIEMSALPMVLFCKIEIADIQPIYIALILNFLIAFCICFIFRKMILKDWVFGLTSNGVLSGLKKYGLPMILASVIVSVSFIIGLQPFDNKPSVLRLIIEGIVYYIGVGIMEELYLRGLLQNLIEKCFGSKDGASLYAILIASALFGIGHIFGALGQPVATIVCKVIWNIGLGIYFGTVYLKTRNLWVPIILHFIVNVGIAIIFCFTTSNKYPMMALLTCLVAYCGLGIYGISIIKRTNLSMRAARGSREKLGEVLDLVPDTEPDMIDKL